LLLDMLGFEVDLAFDEVEFKLAVFHVDLVLGGELMTFEPEFFLTVGGELTFEEVFSGLISLIASTFTP